MMESRMFDSIEAQFETICFIIAVSIPTLMKMF